MRVKHLFLFFIGCYIPCILHAQQPKGVKGVLYKNNSAARIAQALITNLKTNTIMMSDELGMFTIPALPGDTLLVTKKGYDAYKHAIVNVNDIIIYMQPETVINLDEVTVKGLTKQQELTNIMGSYRSQGSLFLGKPPALLFLTSPLTGLYELFGKTPGRAKRFAEYQKKELQASEVDKRYNKPFIMRITGETDTAKVQQFMNFYRPTYDDLKTWADYDLIQHTKTQWEYFQKNGGKDRLQKLY
ncbi:MAG: hypothetical protein EOP46_19080 [Sphingobacteriaceae bacterium]|nr:MAG: hypothetical protein EOP46_19080 [Sphingobacteriaceae bacterium]